ncbi:MAG: glycyl-radical enzyme activating protein, partial [Clostridia bacterium]|nr:glycyl-radical enzyme activating protein [Clostridia bacterium]
LLQTITVHQINLLPYHAIGEGKYERLGMAYDRDAFKVPAAGQLDDFKTIFASKNISVEIGG